MTKKPIDASRRSSPTYRGWLAGLLITGSLLAGCASVRVSSDYDRGASFSSSHTYAWLPREHLRPQNPLAVLADCSREKGGDPITNTKAQWILHIETVPSVQFSGLTRFSMKGDYV